MSYKESNMSLKRFIRQLYIFNFFCEFIFIYAVDKLFFLYRGLDLAQIAVLIAVTSALVILLEVPTGAAADRWNRKYILIISVLLRCAGFVVWIFSRNLLVFILGTVLLIAGFTLESGTLQAYVYDFLTMKEKEDDFEKYWGRGFALRLIGISVALAIGGYLSTISYELIVGLSAGIPLLAIGTVFLLPNVVRIRTKDNPGYLTVLTTGTRKALSNRLLLRVFLYSGIILAGYGIMDQYVPVLLRRDSVCRTHSSASGWQSESVPGVSVHSTRID